MAQTSAGCAYSGHKAHTASARNAMKSPQITGLGSGTASVRDRQIDADRWVGNLYPSLSWRTSRPSLAACGACLTACGTVAQHYPLRMLLAMLGTWPYVEARTRCMIALGVAKRSTYVDRFASGLDDWFLWVREGPAPPPQNQRELSARVPTKILRGSVL